MIGGGGGRDREKGYELGKSYFHFRGEKIWGSEKLNDLSKAILWVNGKAWVLDHLTLKLPATNLCNH